MCAECIQKSVPATHIGCGSPLLYLNLAQHPTVGSFVREDSDILNSTNIRCSGCGKLYPLTVEILLPAIRNLEREIFRYADIFHDKFKNYEDFRWHVFIESQDRQNSCIFLLVIAIIIIFYILW